MKVKVILLVFAIFLTATSSITVFSAPTTVATILNEGLETTAVGSIPTGWGSSTPNYATRVQTVNSNAYAGARALYINSQGYSDEASVYSKQLTVKPNTRYQLSVMCKRSQSVLTRNKVMLGWINSSGSVIRYENNWMGISDTDSYAEQGGMFMSPATASKVIVILGIEPSRAMYFDEIKLYELQAKMVFQDLSITKSVLATGENASITTIIANKTTSSKSTTVSVNLYNRTLTRVNVTNQTQTISANGTKTFTFNVPLSAGVYSGEIVVAASGFETLSSPLFFSAGGVSVSPLAHGTTIDAVDGTDAVILQNEKTAIVFQKIGGRVCYYKTYAWNGTWNLMGISPFLNRIEAKNTAGTKITFPISASTVNIVTLSGKKRVELTGTGVDGDGVTYTLNTNFDMDDTSSVSYEYKLSTTAARNILHFSGPYIVAGEGNYGSTKDLAIYPGVEYLKSQDVAGGAIDYNEKNYVPSPYSVTVPAMNIVKGESQIGLTWTPDQVWNGTNTMPASVFASPDYNLGYKNSHAMGVFLPGGSYIEQNSLTAKANYQLAAGSQMVLNGHLVAEQMNTDTRAYSYWKDKISLPTQPTLSYDFNTAIQKSLNGFANKFYDSTQKGWPEILGTAAPVIRDNENINAIKSYVATLTDQTLKSQVQGVLADVIQAAGGTNALSGSAALRYGNPKKYIDDLIASANSDATTQNADGGFYWNPTTNQQSTMGAAGDTALGIVMRPTQAMLQSAYMTGDATMLQKALNALAFSDRFTVPSGGETWEVPLNQPNLMGSTLAIGCFIDAYELTGNASYLQKAKLWAHRGLPFLYVWNSNREGVSFAVNPVMGSSAFYNGNIEPLRVTWRAKPVQWGGIEFAKQIIRLNKYDSSFDWANTSNGLIKTGVVWQKRTTDLYPQFEGAFTDYIDLQTNYISNVLINPTVLMQGIGMLNGYSVVPDKAAVDTSIGRISIAASEKINNVTANGPFVNFTVNNLSQDNCYAVISHPTKLNDIKADGVSLSSFGYDYAAFQASTVPGWCKDSTKNVTYVRLDKNTVNVTVDARLYCDFLDNGYYDGFSIANAGSVSLANGVLTLGQMTEDVQMTTNVDYIAGSYPYITVKMKNNTNVNTGAVYLAAGGDSTLTHYVNFGLVPNDTQYRTYIIPINSTTVIKLSPTGPDFTTDTVIKRLRIDPLNDGFVPTGTVDIDSIHLLQDVKWDFATDGNYDGFNIVNAGTSSVSGGILTMGQMTDVQLVTDINYCAADYPYITITMKNNTNADSGAIYIAAGGDTSMTHYVSFDVVPNDTQYRTYAIPINTTTVKKIFINGPDFTENSVINRLRVDPLNVAYNPTGTVGIDSIKLAPAYP